jgi:erythromycin esterase
MTFAAVLLLTLVPLNGFQTFDKELAGVQLIGMGESVHETDPFQTFRARLLQDLVRRHKVTALVLESGMPEVMAVDDYVTGRTDSIDFNASMPGYFGPLAETRNTVEWLRKWNAGEGRKRPVRVYGADFSGRAGDLIPTLDRLEALTAGDARSKALLDSIRAVALKTRSTWWKGAADKYATLSAEEKTALAASVTLLSDRVKHLSRSDVARQLAVVLRHNEEGLRVGMYAPTVPRDHAIAEVTLWIVGQLRPGERAVLWAHNAHVQRVAIKGPSVPPGSFIAAGARFDAILGDRYYAIGTTYGGPSRDDATPPKPDSVDAAMAEMKAEGFILPMRNGERPQWAGEERPMRFQNGYLTLKAGEAFDALVYFDRATAAVRSDNPPR